MFPNPVDAFKRLVAEVLAVKVAAEKQNELGVPGIRGLVNLPYLRSLFLPPLVDVREITSRLALDQNWYAMASRFVWLNHHIDRDVDLLLLEVAINLNPDHAHPETECSRSHAMIGLDDE